MRNPSKFHRRKRKQRAKELRCMRRHGRTRQVVRFKQKLRRFWKIMGGRQGAVEKTPDFKLATLKEFADEKCMSPFRHVERNRLRMWKNMKLDQHIRCFVCGGPSTCRHHIIQVHHGGFDWGENLVPLCDYCHDRIHPWMALERAEAELRGMDEAFRLTA